MRVGIWFQAKMEVLYKPQVILLLFPQQMGHLFWSSLPSHSRGILAVIIRPDTVDSLSLCTPVPGIVHISSRLNLTATLSSLYYSSSPWQRWKRRLLPQMCQLVSAWAKASLFPHQHLTAPPGALTLWTQQPSFPELPYYLVCKQQRCATRVSPHTFILRRPLPVSHLPHSKLKDKAMRVSNNHSKGCSIVLIKQEMQMHT